MKLHYQFKILYVNWATHIYILFLKISQCNRSDETVKIFAETNPKCYTRTPCMTSL